MTQPPQQQDRQPGIEKEMSPRPDYKPRFPGVGRLAGKVALITGGDSGIGRAVAVAFANEGADIAIVYKDEAEDAQEAKKAVEECGRRFLSIAGDAGEAAFCEQAVEKTLAEFGKLDILVNNCAEQHMVEAFEDIPVEQIERTFRTNIFSYLFMTKYALKHMKEGATIVNTASITAFKGNPVLIDYSSTRGAAVAFTRALSQQLAKRKIRVNGVAPGPIWTPLIPASFPAEKVKTFGQDVPLGRPGQPNEVASAYVFLASDEGSYVTGQIIHVNGGTPV